jgi:NAD(P)-dependent dehydrogenase (short-subunit alcohol dehydrogenase family)
MGLFLSRYEKFEKKLPNVTGKVFVITGTTSGTGFIAAETVAKHGGEVLLLNRSSSRSVESLEKLKASVPDGKFVPIECDLQDFASVRKAAKEIKETLGYKSIYCLSNNAGIMAVDDTITKTDGFEVQMQTNHLSHFLLTKELFPLILAGSKEYGDARIVQHSSMARHATPSNGLEEKYFTKQEKDGQLGGNEVTGFLKGGNWYRYYQTKLANSVFTQCLHDKLVAAGENNEECKNILSLCAHPGGSNTSLVNHLSFGFFMSAIFSFLMQSAADGSMGLLKGMMDTKENVKCGTLYGPKMLTGNAIPNPPKPYEIDPEAKEMLWRTSEKATGGKFDII